MQAPKNRSHTARPLAPRWTGALLAAAIAGAWVLVALHGCTNEAFDVDTFSNARPIARIFLQSSPTDGSKSYNKQTFYWSGTDSDGYIVGFYVAIADSAVPPTTWTFTTSDETTATYATNVMGRVYPTLYVVAKDDRGALSDTARVTFPLQNFPPTVVLKLNFHPVTESFGAASFDLVGFDQDGDETLQPFVDYRFLGSDPSVVFLPGDPNADPTAGWVRTSSSPTAISLALRNIPPGDPQRLYVRILDQAGASGEFHYDWTVNPVVGKILLVDDCIHDSRDAFYRDALQSITGGQYSVWNIQASGLPAREADIRLTVQQFPLLVWYTSNSPASTNLRASQNVLTEYVTTLDVDPATPGVQHGRLLLEEPIVFGSGSNLSTAFRANVLGIESTIADPRTQLSPYNTTVENAIGPLDILAQDAVVPDVVSVGQNYQGGGGRYSGLYGLVPRAGTAALYRFETTTQWAPQDVGCRPPGCSPVVATRRPATGQADVILLEFQLEWANASGNAIEALRAMIEQELGITTP